MAYQDLAMPVDIPWKRLAASSDMMDTQYGDRRFPPKWRSSVAIFYHEPTELPETYCDRKVTYLKLVCSITGYQVGAETGLPIPAGEEFGSRPAILGEKYHACYGALLQVGVFPNTPDDRSVPLADYPYIIDFEPKRRELYEAVSRSGEILGRSASTLNLRKSATSGETTDYSSRIGAEVKGGISIGVASLGATITGEHRWGGGTHVEEQNVRTTDESREKRETYSSTTSLTQMYELFTGYHLGSNRALFFMISRPHTIEEKDQYTFVNGPRRIEGIQEVFLIVNRPKDQPGICIEAYLETAHLEDEPAKEPPNGGGPPPRPTYTYYESTPFTMSAVWREDRGGVGNTRDYERVVFQLPSGCELDTSRPNPPQSFPVDRFGTLGPLQITVPPGLYFDFQDDTFWRSMQGISLRVSGGEVLATVTLRNGGGNWLPRFTAYVTVYYRCPQTSQQPSDPAPQSQTSDKRTLFLTARGLNACIELEGNEVSRPGNVHQPVDWEKVRDPRYQDQLFEWLARNRVLELEAVTPDEYRQKLQELFEGDQLQFETKLRDAINTGKADPIPNQWLRLAEWVSFERPIPTAPLMSDPAVPAIQRIRAANDLTTRIGQQMIESLGSSRRYPNRTVDFWHTNIALNELTNAVTALPDDHPSNVPVVEMNIPYKEQFLEAFGPELRIKQVVSLDVDALQRGLRLSEIEVRQLKLELLGAVGRRPDLPA